MKTHPDVKIVSVRVAPDATITKGRDWLGRAAFFLQIEYTLADGRTFPGHANTRRKKDLLADIEHTRVAAIKGQLAASFDETGKFFGTVQGFWIGGEPKTPPVAPTPASLAVPA